MEPFASVWLYADSLGRPTGASYTVAIPRKNVFAHITLSTYIPALHSDNDGAAAGVRIVRFDSYKPLGFGSEIVVPTFLTDWNNNAVFVPDCTSITFGMAVKNAQAYACGVIFLY